MKNLLLVLISMYLFIFMDNVSANAIEYSYVEAITKDEIPTGKYIGDYMFEKCDTEDSICVSKNLSSKIIPLEGDATDYSVFYEDDIYLFINQSKDNIPESDLHGSIINNSPIYFFDDNMELIARKDFLGHMKYIKNVDNFLYFIFTDYSKRFYNDSTNSFEGEITTHYYKTKNGIDFYEMEYDEFYEAHNNVVVTKLINGNSFFYEGNELFYLHEEQIHGILRENDAYSICGSQTNKGSILYKVLYDSNSKIQAKKISIDAINYFDIHYDADLSNAKCDNEYLYYRVLRAEDNNWYRIKLSNLEDQVKVLYKDKYLSFSTSPIVENERILVPMRFLFETMGAEVKWDNSEQKIVVEDTENTIEFSINDINVKVNGTLKKMDVPAKLVDSKTMVPIRFLSEELGYNVEWNNITRTVIITK